MDIFTLSMRLIATFLIAIIFGIQRQYSHKPTGFGTFTFVATGSCALAIAAEAINPQNPIPLLSAIVTGVGFLGAGALVKTSDKIYGFTTAASIWLFSIVGLTMGTGRYQISFGLYCLLWVVIFIDSLLEKSSIGSYQKKLFLSVISDNFNGVLEEILKEYDFNIISFQYDREKKKFDVHMFITGSKNELQRIPDKLLARSEVSSFKYE